MLIKNVIFDFDGTIVDSFGEIVRLVNSLSEKYNFEKLTPVQIEKMRCHGIEETIKLLGVNLIKLPFLLMDLKTSYRETLQNLHPFTGIADVLLFLKKKGLFLAMATTNAQDKTKSFLDNNKINDFDYIAGDVGFFSKGDALLEIMKQHGLLAEETIYVGDEIRDIEAAKNAEIKIASVTWGYNNAKILESYSPDFLIEKPSDLLKVITNK